MKRFVLLILALLSLPAFAGPVSQEKAKEMAEKVTGAKVTPVLSSLQTKAADPEYYIWNTSKGGFVIISGDDTVTPVLALSENSTFPETAMPEHVQAWMDMWGNIIRSSRANGTKQNATVAAQWEGPVETKASSGEKKVLETAQWDQGDPFNQYCPVFNGARAVTGCTATATSIIMRYHSWPEVGVGTVGGYSFTSGSETREVGTIDLSEYPYDWSKMPLVVNSSTSAEEASQIARLISNVGVMLHSSYDSQGTAAYSADAAPALRKYMGYDDSAIEHWKNYYEKDEWIELLKTNIDNVGPVLYAGYSKNGGHAFVVDGYDENNRLHINFGWGGYYNGFYTFPYFDEYTQDHMATLNIRKSEGGKPQEELVIDSGDGMIASVENITEGTPFDVSCSWVYNMGPDYFDGEVAIAQLDKDNKIKEILASCYWQMYHYYGDSVYFSDLMVKDIDFGDRLQLCFRSDLTPEWTLVRGNVESDVPYYIELSDSVSIEESTAFEYYASDKKLRITTKTGVELHLYGPDGNEISEGFTNTTRKIEINGNVLPLDTYTLVLTKGKERKEIKIRIGVE